MGGYIHGFGIPQAAQGWQAGQDRRKQAKEKLEFLQFKREEMEYDKKKDAFGMIEKAANLFSNKKFTRSSAAEKTAQFMEKTIKQLYPDIAGDFKIDYKGNVKGQLKDFKLTKLATDIQNVTYKTQGSVAAALSESYDNGDIDENQYNLFKGMMTDNVKESRPKETTQSTPEELKKFELLTFGKERPNLRGSQQYRDEFYKWKQESSFSINAPSEAETEEMADAIGTGRMSLKQIPKRGRSIPQVTSAIQKQWPKFNFMMSDANYNYRNNSAVLRSAGLVKAALPRVVDLYHKSMNLQNLTNIPILDEPLNKIKRAVGNEAVVDFESLRNAIIQEVNTALSGTSVASDYRIKLELENLKSGMTYGQQVKSIGNLLSALDARLEASEVTVFPLEVVQGLKTMDEWKKEQKEESLSIREMRFGVGGSEKPEAPKDNNTTPSSAEDYLKSIGIK